MMLIWPIASSIYKSKILTVNKVKDIGHSKFTLVLLLLVGT